MLEKGYSLLRYHDVADNEPRLLALTSLTPTEFRALVPHYRTEHMSALCSSIQRLTNGFVRQHRRDKEAVGNGEVVLEAARQQTQPQPKQAQIAPILPMQPLQPRVAQGAHAQIYHPQIRQARCDQQARQARRIT